MPYSILLATFLGAAVEWTEAFTIVLAVSLTIGWASAAGAAAAALISGGCLSRAAWMNRQKFFAELFYRA